MNTELHKLALDILTDNDLTDTKQVLKEHGFLSIDNIRSIVNQNSSKQKKRNYTDIDPSLFILINAYINYPIFLTKNCILSSDELYNKYPFEHLGATPETVFTQQEIGMFIQEGQNPDYYFRDISDLPFYSLQDSIRQSINKNYKCTNIANKIIKSNIFVAKESFDDFELMTRFVRGFQKTVLQLTDGQSNVSFQDAAKAVPFFITSMASTNGQLLIKDAKETSQLKSEIDLLKEELNQLKNNNNINKSKGRTKKEINIPKEPKKRGRPRKIKIEE